MTGMRIMLLSFVLLFGLVVWAGLTPGAEWEGVDVSVVEAHAEEMGGVAQPGLFNLAGDLMLFVFAAAGTIGGFVVGYCWRDLFGRTEPAQLKPQPES